MNNVLETYLLKHPDRAHVIEKILCISELGLLDQFLANLLARQYSIAIKKLNDGVTIGDVIPSGPSPVSISRPRVYKRKNKGAARTRAVMELMKDGKMRSINSLAALHGCSPGSIKGDFRTINNALKESGYEIGSMVGHPYNNDQSRERIAKYCGHYIYRKII